MDWAVPVWAHIPLIHGPDGEKLSKRHGALGRRGLPRHGLSGRRRCATTCARLGWSHGDDEFFTTAQALEWFDLQAIGRAPARLDFKKLENVSRPAHRAADDAALLPEIEAFLAASGPSRRSPTSQRDTAARGRCYCLKDRAKTFPELLEKAHFILADAPVVPDDAAARRARCGIPWYTARIDAAAAKC